MSEGDSLYDLIIDAVAASRDTLRVVPQGRDGAFLVSFMMTLDSATTEALRSASDSLKRSAPSVLRRHIRGAFKQCLEDERIMESELKDAA